MSFRDLQRRYDNALPPSYYAPDAEEEEEEIAVCYYCGKPVDCSTLVVGSKRKMICDDCILERHENERGDLDE